MKNKIEIKDKYKPLSCPDAVNTAQKHSATVENLCQQINLTGLKATIVKPRTPSLKPFVKVEFTKNNPTLKLELVGLQMWFSKLLVVTNRTQQGFYIAFSE